MNLIPNNQINLYGLGKNLKQFISLYKKGNLPNKILLSGLKGTGKSTLAYHLINFVLSRNEEFSYSIDKYQINENNKEPVLLSKNETSQTKITKEKVEIAKVEEIKPKQEEFKPETQVADSDPPVIEIAENITVYDTSYEIKGSVKDKSDKIFRNI